MPAPSLTDRLAETKSPDEASDILYSLAEEGDVSAIEPLALWMESNGGELRQLAQQTLERIRSRLSPEEKARATEALENVRRRDRARPKSVNPTATFNVEALASGGAPRAGRPAVGTTTGSRAAAASARPPLDAPITEGVMPTVQIVQQHGKPVLPVKQYPIRLSQLMQDAVAKGASDVHIRSSQAPAYRVDGKLVDSGFPVAEPAMARWLAYRLMDDNRRGLFDAGEEQDLAAEKPGLGRFRVNLFHDIEGPGLVIRVLSNKIRNLTELGGPSVLERFCKARRGLILVTGPTGSGKSTTVAAMLDYINEHRDAHIITIEDPVEFVHKPKRCRITQREVGSNTRSFSDALRSALRQDPDVIMVGEMRDLETMELAMTAAETGHLVLSTLHTQTAPKTIDRILGAFPANRTEQVRTMLAETLLAVVCQVLLPRAKGGGRVAVHEILFRVPAIANLIREGKIFQIPNAMLASVNQGMRLMDESLATLVKSGDVAFDEAMLHAADPEALRQRSL